MHGSVCPCTTFKPFHQSQNRRPSIDYKESIILCHLNCLSMFVYNHLYLGLMFNFLLFKNFSVIDTFLVVELKISNLLIFFVTGEPGVQ